MAYGLTSKLEHKDGTLRRSAHVPERRPGRVVGAGDTIPPGRDGALRVIDTRLDEGTEGDAVSVLVVEPA
jgi:hypothetical protein